MWAWLLRLIAYNSITYDSDSPTPPTRDSRLPGLSDSPDSRTPLTPKTPRLPDSPDSQTPPRPLFPFNRRGRLVRHIVQERTDTRDS